MAPVAPGDKIGVVRLEIGAREPQTAAGARRELAPAEEQHAAIEERGLSLAQLGPVAGDAVGLGLGEAPALRLEGEVEFGDLDDPRRPGHNSSAPLETMTAEPPIEAERNSPPSTSSPSAMRLGRPIS